MTLKGKDMAIATTFLSARWRSLLMFNYEIDARLLAQYVPRGTELDTHDGKTYISVVAFMFRDTRILGMPIPFHRDFEEVNLRFYVRRHDSDIIKRGVVFIKEIVRRRAISAVARWAYNENYCTLPMSHRIDLFNGSLQSDSRVEYRWLSGDRPNHAMATVVDEPVLPADGSLDQFITEQYWGFGTNRRGRTIEYQVEHPPWRLWPVRDTSFQCDVAAIYGTQFSQPLQAEPSSVLVAEGSPIVVRRPCRIQ